MDKLQGRLSSLTLLRQPVWEKENSEFKPVKFCLKLTKCRIPLVQRGLVNIYNIKNIPTSSKKKKKEKENKKKSIKIEDSISQNCY